MSQDMRCLPGTCPSETFHEVVSLRTRMLDFGQFDFGQFDFGQLAEIELAEVEIGRNRN